jgi:hypothetical protein
VTRTTKSGRAFLLCVLVAMIAKIWLTSDIRILPVFAPHDASNFIEHGKDIVTGQWFGHYGDLTLIKGPSFPLFLALVEELGLPLPLAHQLLYGLASLVACLAVRPIVRGTWTLGAVFAVLCFDPFTFGRWAWVAYRSQINDSLAMIAIACALALLVRRKAPPRASLPWLAGLGIAFAAFWFNREESIWLVPGIAVLLAAYLWLSRREARADFRTRLWYCTIPLATWLAAFAAIAAINGAVYGWYTIVETQAPEFVSAYNALARILPPPGTYPAQLVVPRAAREVAYAASPAAAELRPVMEGPVGRDWIAVSCSNGNLCDDIPVGWFLWAFRDAVAGAGHYTSGANARAYYVELAAELDRACDSGRIRCRSKGRSLSPPVSLSQVPAIAGNFATGVRLAVTFAQLSLDPWPDSLRLPGIVNDYEFVARSVEPPNVRVFAGWLVDDRMRSVALEGAHGPERNAVITFSPSPDVYAYLANAGRQPSAQASVARFTLLTTCSEECSLVVTDTGNAQTHIPLAERDLRGASLAYHLDTVTQTHEVNADDRFKAGVLREIASVYRSVIPFGVALALVLTVLRVVRARRRRSAFACEHLVLTLGSAVAGGTLLAILALIETVAFPALNPDYMIALFPLILFAVTIATAIELRVAYRVLLHRLPPPHAIAQN